MVFRSPLALCLALLLAVAAGARESRPAVLFGTWGRRPERIDYQYLQRLQERGFTVDVLDGRDTLTWERLQQFNVFVIMDFPPAGEMRPKPESPPERGPDLAATMALLDRFLAADGGVMISLDRFGDKFYYPATRTALQHWGADVPAETLVAPEERVARHPRLRGEPFFYTNAVQPSPVSEGVHGVWWPHSTFRKFGHFPLVISAGPLAFDDSWTVVVDAGEGSRTEPVDFAPIAANIRLHDPLQRPGGVANPPLYAIKALDHGRLAAFWAMGVFHFVSGTYWLHDGVMFDHGLAGKPSDFGLLVENTFHWLAAPSLAAGTLGGAEVDPARLQPPQLQPNAQAQTDRAWPRFIAGRGQIAGDLYPGFVGARTGLTGGSGTPAAYARAARAKGLKWVVFLEDFSRLDEAKWAAFKKLCADASGPDLTLFPGFRLPTNVGNTLFVYGPDPNLPYPEMLMGPQKSVFMLQPVDDNGDLKGGGEALDYLLYRRGPEGANLGFYDFRGPREKVGAMLPQYLRGYSAAGILFYRDGELVEDMTREFLITNQGTLGSLPLVVDLVDSPAAMAAAVDAGHALTYACARKFEDLWKEALSWNHQFKGPNVSISTGPLIHAWPGCLRLVSFANEDFVVDHSRVAVRLHVTSDVGLREIALYDGEEPFRRLLPNGAREVDRMLHFWGVLQQHISVVATDVRGRRAVSFPFRVSKAGAPGTVSFCGDHVNDGGNMFLARGPTWPPLYIVPQVPVPGLTWDGGPEPVAPLLPLPHITTRVAGDQGEQNIGVQSPLQVPRLVFCDERAQQCMATHTDIITAGYSGQNPWRAWFPIGPAPLFHSWGTMTFWAGAPIGPEPDGPGYTGLRAGPNAHVFQQEMTFLVDQTVSRFEDCYLWQKEIPGVTDTYIEGHDDTVRYSLDITPPTEPRKPVVRRLDTGDWFAGVSDGPANTCLYVNLGPALELKLWSRRIDVREVVPEEGLPVTAGDRHGLSFFSMIWPIDERLATPDAVVAAVAYLREPRGLKLRGTRVDAPPGVLEVQVDGGSMAIQVAKPAADISLNLPVRIHGLNRRWTALLRHQRGYAGTEYYGGQVDRVRPLGVDLEGRACFPLYVSRAPVSQAHAGHPVIADNQHLFISVVATGMDEAGVPTGWHVAVNNPTNNPVRARLRRAMDLPNFAWDGADVELPPGSYRVLLGDE